MNFKETIQAYLDRLAKEDELFAKTYKKANKSLDECCNYITSEAKKQVENGCAVMSDDDVYNLAVHYYDEDTITDSPKVNAKVTCYADLLKRKKPKRKVKTAPPKVDDGLDDEYKLDLPIF